MVWQHGSNGFAMQIEWFGNMVRMVLQRRSNGLKHASDGFATQIKWFCDADRMVWQRASNGFATRIEWFDNTHRMVLQRGSNAFGNADRMVWNTHRVTLQHGLNTFGKGPVGYRPNAASSGWSYGRDILRQLRALHDCCTLTSTADFCLLGKASSQLFYSSS